MERNRETRRGTMNGGRLSRRRQRSSGAGGLNRDSPEDEGEIEMQETTTTATRLRDRGCKKDRDRVHVRSGRNQRRRMINGGRRDDVDDSSEEEEESLDGDEEDDDGGDDDRFQPPSVSQTHHRKSFPVRPLRVPPWKAADEIGVPIPKKARSAFAKRSPESWNSGSSSVGGEQIHHSTSPSMLPAAQILPTSSNASAARKKMKPMINGTTSKQRPPPSKILMKSSPEQEAIEMEIAEVLSKLRKQEDPSHCFDPRAANGSRNEGRLQVSSSPNSVTPLVQPSNPSSNATSSVIAPNWKRPHPVNNFEDESPTSPLSSVALPSTLVSSAVQMDTDQQARSEEISLKLEKPVQLSVNENGAVMLNFSAPQTVSAPSLTQGGLEKLDGSTVPQSTVPTAEHGDRGQDDVKEEDAKGLPHIDLDEAITVKVTLAADSLQGDKFTIDLMAPPPGKTSPEREDFCRVVSNNFCRPVSQEMELFPKIDRLKKEAEAVGSMVNQNVGESSGRRAEKTVIEDLHLKKQTYKGKTPIIEDLDLKKQMAKGNTLEHQLDIEKPKQQSQAPRVELQADKTAPSSLPVSTSVAGWPGSFPSFGYVGQIPSVQPIVPAMNAAIASFSMMRPPVRQKRCSTHCFIAQSIQYHEKIMKVNPFWHSATGTAQLLGARPPYNLNAMPDALHGNPLQANIQGRSTGSLHDSQGAPILTSFAGHPAKDNLLMVNANMTEAAQRKQALQQTLPQAGSANNITQNPALFYPLNPHLAAVAAAARSGAANSSMVVGNATSSSGASSSIVATSGSARPMAAMNFGFAMPSSDAQYFAILQNNGYTYPMSAHAGGPPSYRGGSPAQAMPFVNGPFFSPQMLHHPQQLQQQQPTPTSATQQHQRAQTGQQNLCTSSDSSSSHKHHQKPQRQPGAGASGAGPSSHIFQYSKQHSQLQINQSRQLESDTGCEDSPSAADSRVSQAQKTLSGQNLAMLSYPQNIGMMSPAATATGSSSGANHSEKQPTQQQQQPAMKVDLTPSQAFAMSFVSMNGGVPPSGIDFSSMAQNHAMFQSLQEATRHGYPMPTAAAAEKKSHLHATEAGRSAGNSVINLDNAAEEKKILAARKAPAPHGSHHSFSFSKLDQETLMNTNAGNNIVDGPSQVNLDPSSTSSSRTSSRPSNTASTPATAAAPSTPLGNPTFQQFQLQKQARELQLEHQMASARTKPSASGNNVVAYSEHLPLGSLAKFPQTSTGFPQGLIQGGSSGQSPKWKTSGRMAAPPVTAADLLVGKNHPVQQQGGATFTPNHQISFGPNAVKSTPAGTQHLAGSGTNNVSASSTAAASAVVAVVSPSNSVSRSTGGSLRASTNVKPAPTASTTALHQQSSSKSSASSSSRNSSPKHNAPSILGQPQHTNHDTSSNSSKQFSQLQQSRLQPQPPLQPQTQTQTQPQPQPQPQLFFSNAVYMQAQAPQSSTAAASAGANLYRRQLEQQQQQQQKMVHLQQQQMSQPQQMVQQQHQQQMSQPRQIVQQLAKQQLQQQQLSQQQQMSQQQQQQQKQPSKQQQQQQQIMQMAQQQIAHQQMVQQLLQQQQMSRQQQQQQKQQSKQQQKPKQSSNPVSSGMHPSGSDHSKSTGAASATANSMKGLPPPGLMHAAQVQLAAQSSSSGATHTSISTAAAGFPYMSMPPASAKSSDQKPAAGNDNSNEGSW